MNLSELIKSNAYETTFETCSGCENHCNVKLFRFANGNTFASGNNCEKIYSNTHESVRQGINMFAEKQTLLFGRKSIKSPERQQVIGIPRGLGIYENYPFWHTLFTFCGFKVQLSKPSTNKLYESGLRTVMADNICFPAKLMHGHIFDLVARKVDRIFYPWVVFEQKEDACSKNSFNCPIVSGYSDVLKSAIDTEKHYGIPFDAPVVSFNDDKLLEQSCVAYLHTLGVAKNEAKQAVAAAKAAQHAYIAQLTERANAILQRATAEHRMVILLAGRPYHTDPLIEHKIAQAIADMGIDVITEHVATNSGSDVYNELNALSQWAYPNRIFKAAYFAAKYPHNNLQFVELTSFGCGPDAFILDEVNAVLRRYNKNLTILKIDDVNNIGSLRLRIRSLVESTKTAAPATTTPKPYITTKIFDIDDRRRTLLAPYFAEGYSEFLPSVFKLAGYKLINLPTGNQEAAETGLRFANNDICYPATIVVGSIMNALESGQYNRDEVAVIITQTGGQCRASNYYSLIKNAMVSAGFQDIPVVSMATGPGIGNHQPGFSLAWRKLTNIVLDVMFYADCIAKMYYASAVRETIKGEAKRLRQHYIEAAFPLVEANDSKALKRLLREAACAFARIVDTSRRVPVIGLVGEIYVKYNGFSHKFVVDWLVEQGVEVVPPALTGFFSTSFVSNHANRQLHIKPEKRPRWLNDAIYKYVWRRSQQFDELCQPFPFYRKFVNIFDYARLSEQVISTAADFGEGWFLPGEICHLAESGIQNVVSLQPFGCIANHIISKGIEKKIKQVYPQLSLLFLDFDSSTSEANVFNRLHFMVENCKHQLKNN